MRINKYLASGMTFSEASAARRADREANAAANAAKKAARDAKVRHCQICGRQILANTGKIAHHGYERPGHGWQTASCFGARWRPYEVACDALPPAIESLSGYICREIEDLDDFIANPPVGITVLQRPRYDERPQPHHTALRAAGFDPNGQRDRYSRTEYENLYDSRREERRQRIMRATQDLNTLKQRLADWRAP